jgi:hypothetical protein
MKMTSVLSALVSLSLFGTVSMAADSGENNLNPLTLSELELDSPNAATRAVDNKICYFNDWESRDDIARRLNTYHCRFSYPDGHGTMYCTLKEC